MLRFDGLHSYSIGSTQADYSNDLLYGFFGLNLGCPVQAAKLNLQVGSSILTTSVVPVVANLRTE
jgi:hypothetical protein